MSKLYFSISELIHSDKAILHRINNMPDINSLDNMLNLIHYCLNPIRTAIKKPMLVTSGYRCEELNKLVGGADNSNHLTGCACDFIIKGMKPKEIIKFITAMNIEYDELVNEYDSWVHIAYRHNNNRMKQFKVE